MAGEPTTIENQSSNLENPNPLEEAVAVAELDKEKQDLYRESKSVLKDVASYADETQENNYFRAFRASGITSELQLDDPVYFFNSFNYIYANNLLASEAQNNLASVVFPAESSPEEKRNNLEFFKLMMTRFSDLSKWDVARKSTEYNKFIDQYAPPELNPKLNKAFKSEKTVLKFYKAVADVRYEMQKGYKMAKQSEKRMEELTGTQSTVKKNIDNLIGNYKRAGKMVPPELFVAMTTIGLILSFSKNHKDWGYGLLAAGLGTQILMNIETPNPKQKISRNYKRLYSTNVLRERTGKKSIAMLESMATTSTAKFSFGTYWEIYNKAKGDKSFIELQNAYSNEEDDTKIPQLVFDAINLNDRSTAFEAMYAFEKANLRLIERLQKTTITLDGGRSMNAWEAFLEMPFGLAVNAVTTALGSGQSLDDGFTTIFGRLYNDAINGAAGAYSVVKSELDKQRRNFLGEGSEMSTAMQSIGIENSEYDVDSQVLSAYGTEFELKEWLNADGTSKQKIAEGAKGGRFIYYIPDTDGAFQEETIDIYFNNKNSKKKKDFEDISRPIYQKKLVDAGFATESEMEWDDKIAPASWKLLYSEEKKFGVKIAKKELILKNALNKEATNLSEKYVFSFSIKDEPKEVFYSKQEIEKKLYKQSLQKEFSKVSGIPSEDIFISDNELSKLNPDNPRILASIRKNKNGQIIEVKTTFTYDESKSDNNWSYEIDDDIESQNDFINLIFLSLQDEVFKINRGHLFGLDMPFRKTISDILGNRFGLEDKEWESMAEALAGHVKEVLKQTPEDQRKDYIKRVTDSTSALVNSLKVYEPGGDKAREVPPQGIFNSWKQKLGQITVDDDYKDISGKFRNDLFEDINFADYSITGDLYYFSINELEKEFDKHPELNKDQKREYVKYISKKYYDLGLIVDRDQDKYIVNKDKYKIGEKLMPNYDKFKEENSEANKENQLMEIEERIFEKKKIENLWPEARVIIKAYALRKRHDYLDPNSKWKKDNPDKTFEEIKKLHEKDLEHITVGNIVLLISQESRDKFNKYKDKMGDQASDLWTWTKEKGLGGILNWLAKNLGYLVGDILGAALRIVYFAVAGTAESIASIREKQSNETAPTTKNGTRVLPYENTEGKSISRDGTENIQTNSEPQIVMDDFTQRSETSNIPVDGIANAENLKINGPIDLFMDNRKNFQKYFYPGDIAIIWHGSLNPTDNLFVRVIAVDESYPGGLAVVYNYHTHKIERHPLKNLYKSIDYQDRRNAKEIPTASLIVFINEENTRNYGRSTGRWSENALGGYSIEIELKNGNKEMVDMDDVCHVGTIAESEKTREIKTGLKAYNEWSKYVDKDGELKLENQKANYLIRDIVDDSAEAGDYDVMEIMGSIDGTDNYEILGQIFIHKSGSPIKIIPLRNQIPSDEIYEVKNAIDAKAVIETILDIPSNEAYTEILGELRKYKNLAGMEVAQVNDDPNINEDLNNIIDNKNNSRTIYLRDSGRSNIIGSIEFDVADIAKHEKSIETSKIPIRIYSYDESGNRSLQKTTSLIDLLQDITQIIKTAIREDRDKKVKTLTEATYRNNIRVEKNINEAQRLKDNLTHGGELLDVKQNAELKGYIKISYEDGILSYLQTPIGPMIKSTDWKEYPGDLADLPYAVCKVEVVSSSIIDQIKANISYTEFSEALDPLREIVNDDSKDLKAEMLNILDDLALMHSDGKHNKWSNIDEEARPRYEFAVQVSLYLLGYGNKVGTIDGAWGGNTQKAIEEAYDDAVKADTIPDTTNINNKFDASEIIRSLLTKSKSTIIVGKRNEADNNIEGEKIPEEAPLKTKPSEERTTETEAKIAKPKETKTPPEAAERRVEEPTEIDAEWEEMKSKIQEDLKINPDIKEIIDAINKEPKNPEKIIYGRMLGFIESIDGVINAKYIFLSQCALYLLGYKIPEINAQWDVNNPSDPTQEAVIKLNNSRPYLKVDEANLKNQQMLSVMIRGALSEKYKLGNVLQ